MARTWAKLLFGLACATALTAAPVYGADQGLQSQLLTSVFARPRQEWLEILKRSSELLDESFFQRVDQRIRWSTTNNQIDDAVRFAQVGDLALQAVGKPGSHRWMLVHSFDKIGDETLARQLLEDILLTDPDNHLARYRIATLLYRDGLLDSAAQQFLRLLAAGHKTAECHYLLANIYIKLNRLADAESHFKGAFEGQEGPSHLRLDFVGFPAERERPSQWISKLSIECFRKAEKALVDGQLQPAETNYQKAIVANPKDATSRIYLGALYYRMGKIEEAIAHLNMGLALDLKNQEGWRYIACAFERCFDSGRSPQDLRNALAAYRKALELQPDDLVSQMGVERVQAKIRR